MRHRPPRTGHARAVVVIALVTASLVSFASSGASTAETRSPWASLTPGLDWARLRVETPETERSVNILAIRLDPSRIGLRVLDAHAHERTVWSAATATRETGALAAINGSFFDESGKPMGLLVDAGVQLNPLRKVDWGVFYVAGGKARVVHTRDWKKPEGLRFAIQAGPRLVVAGRVTTVKPSFARRSALCIHADGRVSLVATESGVMLSEFAEILRRPPTEDGLGCVDALNLDGGSSTQLHVAAADGPRGIVAPDDVPVMVGVEPLPAP